MKNYETLGKDEPGDEKIAEFSREEVLDLGKDVLRLWDDDFGVVLPFAPLDDNSGGGGLEDDFGEVEEGLDEVVDYDDGEGTWTVEGIRSYFSDKSMANLELLKDKNHTLAEIYRNLCDEYPQLKCVILKDTSKYADKVDGRGCGFVADALSSHLPEVKFNLSGSGQSDTEMSTRVWQETIAKGLGMSYDEVAADGRLFGVVGFLHEFGHAYDFLTNAMGYDGVEKEELCRKWEVQTAFDNGKEFAKIFELDERKREYEEGKLPSEIEYFANVAKYGTYDDFKRLQAQKYREMEDEKYADDFAIKYVLEHADKGWFGNFGKKMMA